MKKLVYLLYLIVITFSILEIGIRVLTKKNPANVDLFLGMKHRYLLPLPTDPDSYYSGATTENENDGYRTYDDSLGWSHIPWGSNSKDFPCFANDKGFRITEDDYLKKVSSQNHYDIVTIGNSFTHGDAVTCEDSWPFLLGEKSGKSIANLGVGGYGIQQALMRFMFSGITADTVLFGAISGDFERALEPVYTFYQGGNKTKPLLKFSKEEVDFINVPVLSPKEFYSLKKLHEAEIFSHIPGFDGEVFSEGFWTKSYLIRILVSLSHQKRNIKEKPVYLTDDADLVECVRIFKLFNSYCQSNGMYAKVILLDNTQNFVHQEKWGLDNPWKLVEEKLQQQEIPFVDFHSSLLKAFKEQRESLIHPVENLHYSPKGNALVSDLLLQNLKLKEIN